MHLTQAQAARAAAVSRTTIWRAVKSGRISVVDVDGEHLIEPSELLRVFPQADLARAHETVHSDGVRHDERHGEIAALRTFIDNLLSDKERQAAELQRAAAEREKFMEMLRQKDETITHKDQLLAEQMQTVKLIEDQRTKKKRWWRWW